MAEIINLNRARKAKLRAGAKTQAEANRAKFGRTRAARERDTADQVRRDTLLDGARRDD